MGIENSFEVANVLVIGQSDSITTQKLNQTN